MRFFDFKKKWAENSQNEGARIVIRNMLMGAIREGNEKNVTWALNQPEPHLPQGAQKSMIHDVFLTSLRYKSDDREVAARISKLLIEKIGTEDIQGDFGEVALHASVENKDKMNAELLLAAGASMTAMSYHSITPVSVAARKGETDLLRMFIEENGGKWPSVREGNGQNALHLACEYRHTDCARILLLANVDPNERSGVGLKSKRAIHYAAGNVMNEIVDLILAMGGSAEVKDDWGATPLHYLAVSNAYVENVEDILICFRKLAQAGCPLDSKNDSGMEPLDYAIKTKKIALVKALIEAGVRVSVEAGSRPRSETVIDFGNTDLEVFLRSAEERESLESESNEAQPRAKRKI